MAILISIIIIIIVIVIITALVNHYIEFFRQNKDNDQIKLKIIDKI